MNWPELNGFGPEGFSALLRHTTVSDLAKRLTVAEDQIHQWRRNGVPDGHAAALLRYFARDNGISIKVPPTGVPCLLCGAPHTIRFGEHPLCDFCHTEPTKAGEALGFVFKTEHHDINGSWVGVGAPRAFEFPAAAKMRRQRATLFGNPDPEIGHPDFDDVVHIETDDYEAFFDLMQHPRRRDLARALAEKVEIQINVDTVYAIIPVGKRVHMDRLTLTLLLLAWSLMNDRSPHLADP